MSHHRRGLPLVAGLLTASALAVAAPRASATATGVDPPLRLRDQSFVIPGVDATDALKITIAGTALGSAPCTTERDTVRVIAYRPVTTRQEADDVLADPGSERDHVSFDLCDLERQPNGALQLTIATDIDGDGVIGDGAPGTDGPAQAPGTAAGNADAPTEPAVEPLHLPDAGVVPVGVEIRRAGDVDGSLITFVDRLEDGTDADDEVDSRMQVGAAFLVDGGPTLQADGARVVSDADRTAVNTALELVGQTADAPIALGIRPELVEGMYASPADREAFDELADALSADRVSLLSLPYVRVDPSSAGASDADDLFADQVRRGEDVFRQLIPGARTQRSLWLFDAPVSAEGAELLRRAGVQLGALLPSAALPSLAPSDRQFEIDYGGGTLPATPVDDRIAAALADPGPDAVLTAYHLAARVLLTRQEAADAEGQWWTPMVEHNMILSTPTGRIGNVETTATLIRLLGDVPQLDLVAPPSITSKSILDQAGMPYRVTPPDTDIASLNTVNADVSSVRTIVDAVASMLPPGDARPAGWRQQLAVAASAGLDNATRRAHLDAVRSATTAIRRSIVPLRPSSFTLGGRHSTIRLTLTNTGPDDLTVRVIIDSTKLEIAPEDKNRLVRLPAGQSVEEKVPVEARTNGEFPVDIQIVTPADEGIAIAEPVQLSARVNALTGLGQFATGAFVLVLLTWWAQHLRKRRRGTPQAAAT